MDLAMWMGDGTFIYHGKNGDGNGTFNGSVNNQPASWLPGTTSVHFRGQSILRESIAKLAAELLAVKQEKENTYKPVASSHVRNL